MSSNKSNKWKKVGGRSRGANYNAARIPPQTTNTFNISDLINKTSTYSGADTIVTSTLNDYYNSSNLFSIDPINNSSSFKGHVYIDRTGIINEPAGNEVVTADWVDNKYGNSDIGTTYAEDVNDIQNLTSQLNDVQQLISQQGVAINTMKTRLTASDQDKIDKLVKKIDITQKMINHHAQNVTNIRLNATSQMAIDELTRTVSKIRLF